MSGERGGAVGGEETVAWKRCVEILQGWLWWREVCEGW